MYSEGRWNNYSGAIFWTVKCNVSDIDQTIKIHEIQEVLNMDLIRVI
jgi:hypothetical protein